MTDFSEYDKIAFGRILRGEGDWFHAMLARLFAKADNNNFYLLSHAYPDEAKFFQWYREVGQWHDSKLEIENGTYENLMIEAGVK